MKPNQKSKDSRAKQGKEPSAPDAAGNSSKEKEQGRGAGPSQPSALPPGIRWFVSKTVRQAATMQKHVRNIFNAQRDLLSPPSIAAVEVGLGEMQTALKSGATVENLRKQMEKLEECANKWLKPYPHAGFRENVEVLLVALAVAMAIRTFFLQPFKIPTGSMQPTLFGVTSENLIHQPEVKIPTGLKRVREWFEGISYIDVKAKTDGLLQRVTAPVGIRIIDFWQTLYIGGKAHLISFPPDYGSPPAGTLEARAGLKLGEEFHKGDQVVRLRTQAGDHLFVDRLTFNFRKPRRGEIVVFQTAGMDPARREDRLGRWQIPPDQFYIKRLVALGGEAVKIGADHHLVINGRRLDASTVGFENVYAWHKLDPDLPYIGHVPLELFADGAEFQVAPKRFMVMGDNTRSSLDSRYFGDVDENSIIGKSFFVYWPITSRFGLGYR
jgi:signal peptidase I